MYVKCRLDPCALCSNVAEIGFLSCYFLVESDTSIGGARLAICCDATVVLTYYVLVDIEYIDVYKTTIHCS